MVCRAARVTTNLVQPQSTTPGQHARHKTRQVDRCLHSLQTMSGPPQGPQVRYTPVNQHLNYTSSFRRDRGKTGVYSDIRRPPPLGFGRTTSAPVGPRGCRSLCPPGKAPPELPRDFLTSIRTIRGYHHNVGTALLSYRVHKAGSTNRQNFCLDWSANSGCGALNCSL